MRLGQNVFGMMVLGGAFFGTSIGSQAQVTKTPEGYVFKRKFTQGMKIGFKMDMAWNVEGLSKSAMGASGANGKMTTGFALTVKEIKGDSAKILAVAEPTMLNGKQMSPGQSTESTMKLKSGGLGKEEDFLRVIFPSKPIKEGEKYTLLDETMKERPQCQFVGLKTVNGKQAALILMHFDTKAGGSDQGTMKVTSTALVDVNDGWPLSITIRGGVSGKEKEKSFNATFTSNVARKP